MAKPFFKYFIRLSIGFLAAWSFIGAIYAKDYSGHYYLQGATEVGSELIIKSDGSFNWALAYGAMDKSDSGRWTVEGNKLILNFPRGSNNADPRSLSAPFDKLVLVIKGSILVSEKLSGSYVKN
jgi:hypothetical protein